MCKRIKCWYECPKPPGPKNEALYTLKYLCPKKNQKKLLRLDNETKNAQEKKNKSR